MIKVKNVIEEFFARVRRGSRETLFDEEYYCQKYPDVFAAGIEPYQHYIRYGVGENRSPNLYFDTRFYLSQTTENPIDPTRHYLRKGAAAGLDPHPLFDTRWYLAANPDVAAAGINPLRHYLKHGRHEGRCTAPHFRTVFGELPGFSRSSMVHKYSRITLQARKKVLQLPNEKAGRLHEAYFLMTSVTPSERQAFLVGVKALSEARFSTGGHPSVSLELACQESSKLPTMAILCKSAFVRHSKNCIRVDATTVNIYDIHLSNATFVGAFGPILFHAESVSGCEVRP